MTSPGTDRAVDVVRGLIANLDDSTVRAVLDAVVRGIVHGVGEEIADRLIEAIVGQLGERSDSDDQADESVAAEPAVVTVDPTPVPAAPPAATPPHHRGQDATQYTCTLCGRTGSRRFEVDAITLQPRCQDTAACSRRRRDAADVTRPPAPPAPEMPAVQTPPPPPPPPPRPATPGVTARCRDCPRTWNLTGRPLEQAAEMHEFRQSHVVEILDGKATK